MRSRNSTARPPLRNTALMSSTPEWASGVLEAIDPPFLTQGWLSKTVRCPTLSSCATSFLCVLDAGHTQRVPHAESPPGTLGEPPATLAGSLLWVALSA